MTRVLVLGSSGRIGTMLRRVWDAPTATQDIALIYQTRDPSAQQAGDLFWDISAPLPSDLLAVGPIDCVLVLSGVVPRNGADVMLNTSIGIKSLTAAKVLGAHSVLLASTSAVYGAQSDTPYRETDPTEPANDYGRAKLEMEQQCAAHARALGLRLCNLRIGNVAGADALLINGAALAAGEALTIDRFADGGTPLRSYIGPHTLAQVIGSLIRQHATLPATLNIGAPTPVEMAALALAARMPFDLVPASGTAHQFITLDCDALAAFHPFSAADNDPAQMVAQWQNLRN